MISAQQCHPSVPISASHECPAVPPNSCTHQCCPAVPPVSAIISAQQCRLSVQQNQCLLINAHQCCLISATSSVQPISAHH
ncbi:unnamed protein product [Staurois parvus]|uniref:Uncharacterized protein n=1 Tax=Staurois parvus TaxID=386267 RepID=A0ABN9CSA8_9NEOB|nr:unnamed protein product [Staurois parvus]